MDEQRARATLDALDDADLDKPTRRTTSHRPSALLLLIGLHPLMHAGQFVAVRRLLDKPVVF